MSPSPPALSPTPSRAGVTAGVAPVDLPALLGLGDPPRSLSRSLSRSLTRPHLPRVAIVGAGPTGLYTLLHLVRAARRPLCIDLFERGPVAGPGMPYAEALGAPALLANIAGRELPPVTETLSDWMRRQPEARLQALGVDPAAISEVAFFPRVALGAYFTAQFAELVAQARAAGHRVELHRHHAVRDVQPLAGGVRILADSPEGPQLSDHDEVVLATGHRWRDATLDSGVSALSPWPAERLARLPAQRIAVLGSALSALDAAVTIACARGRFDEEEEGERVTYRAEPGRGAFHLTLASRKGLLPEADFWYDLPLPDLPRLAALTADLTAATAPGAGLFARAFAAFRADLAAADPAFCARQPGLTDSPEALHDGYFAARLAADPFDWAARNLSEAVASCRERRAAPWRSALLRAHELFEDVLPHVSESDLGRFHATLRPVFADSYASVPHASIRRLLALKAAGHLSVLRLGPDGGVAPGPGGSVILHDGAGAPAAEPCEVLIDARGQQGVDPGDLGFPSLAPLWRAARRPRFDRYDFDLPGGGRLHCLALPALLWRRPFVQGLVNADQMGRETAERLLARQDAAAAEG